MPTFRRQVLPVVAPILISILGVAACSSPSAVPSGDSGTSFASRASSPTGSTGESTSGAPGVWPSSMAALGHSGLTGFDSADAAADEPSNSWATGTNPDIDSVYLRILAENPDIEGNARNFAVSGSDIDGLLSQSGRISELDPVPDLILVQSIDNDIQCDGTDVDNLPIFRDQLSTVLDTLTAAAPDADIVFVSQWATVQEYSETLLTIDPQRLAGSGPCDVVDPETLKMVPAQVAALQGLVDDYFGAITEVCADYPQCRTDDGAMQQMDLEPQDLTPDANHLSVTGQAKMAAIAWSVLYPGR